MAEPKKLVPLPGSERQVLPSAHAVADANPQETVKVTVYVRPRSAEIPDINIEQANETPPQWRSYLTPQQFSEMLGADPAELDKVAEWATSQGLSVVEKSPVKRSVVLEGSAETLGRAFGTELKEYEHPTGRYRGRTGPVLVPQDLSNIIEAVFGLDNRRVGRAYLRRGRRPITSHAAQPPNIYFAPQVASIYNFPPGADGNGQTIGIFAFNGRVGDTGIQALGGYDPAQLKTYFDTLRLAVPEIADVVVHGPGNVPGDGTDPNDVTEEVLLDIQVAGGCAPRARLVVYFTEFTEQGWVDAIVTAATDEQHNPSVISISYGNPEDANDVSLWTKAAIRKVNEAFRTAALRGMTVCCASGDDGARDQVNDRLAHVDFPASSPWVLACGGTRLETSLGSVRETVWNDGPGSAGGGGVSRLFGVPSYQRFVALPRSINPGHRFGRVVPDVSGDADPDTGFLIVGPSGQFEGPIGGTSATAPLWAALIAVINQVIGTRVGFLNPVLYKFMASGVLRDITIGDNGGYSAGPGFDACTGLGSPDGTRLLAGLYALGGGVSANAQSPPSQPIQPNPASTTDDISSRLAAIEYRLTAEAAERQSLIAIVGSIVQSLKRLGL